MLQILCSKLLKSLSRRSIFFFLPTIKSRTQIISFPQNLPYLERFLEEEGLLKTQASLIARLVSSQEEAKRLATNKSFIDLLDQAKKFTELLLTDSNRAYLQVGVLVPLAVEKAEQGRLVDVLSLLIAERLTEMIAREKMDGVLKAKKM